MMAWDFVDIDGFAYMWQKVNKYLAYHSAFVFKQETFWCKKDDHVLNWKNKSIAARRQLFSNGVGEKSQ